MNLPSRDDLPTHLYALSGLPRSGTTLLASMFSVHSRFEAVFEPWNGSVLPQRGDVPIALLSELERLPPLQGKRLLIKETGKTPEFVNYLREFCERAPPGIERRMIAILRDPVETFLSRFERGLQWWGATHELTQATFDRWCFNSRKGLAAILQFAEAADGVFVQMEGLVAKPRRVFPALAELVGFTPEPAQYEYEKHVQKRRVRGDINIGTSPAPIGAETAASREALREKAHAYLAKGEHRQWVERMQALHGEIGAAGSVVHYKSLHSLGLENPP